MITRLMARNFKPWADTGSLRLTPLTGLFGTNSSGKGAVLQLLLMLKQTAESADRERVLHTGDEKTYVDLGTFYDIVRGHETPGAVSFGLNWRLPSPLVVASPEVDALGRQEHVLFTIQSIGFAAVIEGSPGGIAVDRFEYTFSSGGKDYSFGMRRTKAGEYELISSGHSPTVRLLHAALAGESGRLGRKPPVVPPPVKSYGFPDQVYAFFRNVSFLSDLVLAFEQLFNGVYYLGPPREYPPAATHGEANAPRMSGGAENWRSTPFSPLEASRTSARGRRAIGWIWRPASRSG